MAPSTGEGTDVLGEGVEHVEAAQIFVNAQGISNPERWCAMYVPLPEPRSRTALPALVTTLAPPHQRLLNG